MTAAYLHIRATVPSCPALVAYRLAAGRPVGSTILDTHTMLRAMLAARGA